MNSTHFYFFFQKHKVNAFLFPFPYVPWVSLEGQAFLSFSLLLWSVCILRLSGCIGNVFFISASMKRKYCLNQCLLLYCPLKKRSYLYQWTNLCRRTWEASFSLPDSSTRLEFSIGMQMMILTKPIGHSNSNKTLLQYSVRNLLCYDVYKDKKLTSWYVVYFYCYLVYLTHCSLTRVLFCFSLSCIFLP